MSLYRNIFIFFVASIQSLGALQGGAEEGSIHVDVEERTEIDESFDTDYFFSEDVREVREEVLTLDKLPKWAEGNQEKAREYYRLHAESMLDQFFGSAACFWGTIIHGDIDQNQLAKLLSSFDIHKLLHVGPYDNSTLSLSAQQLIFDSLQLPQIYDIHIHNLGYDENNYLNPKASVPGVAAWSDYFTFMVMRYAAGMRSPIGSTQEARRRIQLYAEHFPKLCGILLPIHQAILADGKVDWDNTGNYLTNKAAKKTAQTFQGKHSQLLAAVSIHPFDLEWKRKMVEAHARGVRLIKWMPPQSIPPDSDQIDEYYKMMRDLGMVLIAHAGPEHTIPTTEDNKIWEDWGNPLRFRKPLQLGVNVILAHCGHKDLIPDLDDADHSPIQGFRLFLRLAREAHIKNQTGEWEGKLYGDLAGVLAHYGSDFIRELLLCAHEEGVRLVYGSDYPFTNLLKPGNDAYELCAKAGLLDSSKVEPLKEIRNWNPLLANYVFARNVAIETSEGQLTFPDRVFTGDVFEDFQFSN
jgi:predicted TIM-barrel fold metal-dependent hydrolase